jgi:hypothetical protein
MKNESTYDEFRRFVKEVEAQTGHEYDMMNPIDDSLLSSKIVHSLITKEFSRQK